MRDAFGNFKNYWGLGAAPPQMLLLVLSVALLAAVVWWQWADRRVRNPGLILLAVCGGAIFYQLVVGA